MEDTEIPITLKEFCKKYTWPSEGALRIMCSQRKKNGLQEAFVEAGKKRRLVLPLTLFRLIKEGKKV